MAPSCAPPGNPSSQVGLRPARRHCPSRSVLHFGSREHPAGLPFGRCVISAGRPCTCRMRGHLPSPTQRSASPRTACWVPGASYCSMATVRASFRLCCCRRGPHLPGWLPGLTHLLMKRALQKTCWRGLGVSLGCQKGPLRKRSQCWPNLIPPRSNRGTRR